MVLCSETPWLARKACFVGPWMAFFVRLGCLGGLLRVPWEGFLRLWGAWGEVLGMARGASEGFGRPCSPNVKKHPFVGSHFGAPNGPKKHEKTFKKTASSSAVFLSMLWVVFSCFRDHFLRPRTLRNGGFVSTGAVFLATG